MGYHPAVNHYTLYTIFNFNFKGRYPCQQQSTALCRTLYGVPELNKLYPSFFNAVFQSLKVNYSKTKTDFPRIFRERVARCSKSESSWSAASSRHIASVVLWVSAASTLRAASALLWASATVGLSVDQLRKRDNVITTRITSTIHNPLARRNGMERERRRKDKETTEILIKNNMWHAI